MYTHTQPSLPRLSRSWHCSTSEGLCLFKPPTLFYLSQEPQNLRLPAPLQLCTGTLDFHHFRQLYPPTIRQTPTIQLCGFQYGMESLSRLLKLLLLQIPFSGSWPSYSSNHQSLVSTSTTGTSNPLLFGPLILVAVATGFCETTVGYILISLSRTALRCLQSGHTSSSTMSLRSFGPGPHQHDSEISPGLNPSGHVATCQ